MNPCLNGVFTLQETFLSLRRPTVRPACAHGTLGVRHGALAHMADDAHKLVEPRADQSFLRRICTVEPLPLAAPGSLRSNGIHGSLILEPVHGIVGQPAILLQCVRCLLYGKHAMLMTCARLTGSAAEPPVEFAEEEEEEEEEKYPEDH